LCVRFFTHKALPLQSLQRLLFLGARRCYCRRSLCTFSSPAGARSGRCRRSLYRVQQNDEVFGDETIIVVAAAGLHAACVSDKGTVWTWGIGDHGTLGHGNREPKRRPTKLGREMYGDAPALMISCTLVLTVTGLVWSCGLGEHGRLGHGNTADKWILTLIETGDILGTDIIFIAAGGLHSMALEATGTVRTWGFSESGQLGHNNLEDRLMPTAVTREAFNMHKVVSVAAGRVHSV